MMKKAVTLFLLAAGLAGALCAQKKDVTKGVPHLDHVFVIMMEGQAQGNCHWSGKNGKSLRISSSLG
jgi:hypothetical protein